MRYFWILILLKASLANAANLVAVEGQETFVAINSELGSIVELPAPVKTVTPSKFFVLQDLASGTGGAKADVRTFLIKPVAQAAAELLTFVLANGRAISLKLLPATAADKYHSITLDARRPVHGAKFLSAEMAMMRAMLVDEGGGFAREVLQEGDQRTKVQVEFDGLEFSLARIYAAADLTGYVFIVKNRSAQALHLNLSSLAFARPNRAVLAQLDQAELSSCPILASSSACQTALRLVVKGPKLPEPVLTTIAPSAAPFAQPATLGGAM